MFHYTEFASKAAVNRKDKKVTGISTASDCAAICDKETNVHCRSFNFCPGTNECYLSETHLVDGTELSSNDLVCTHYSSKHAVTSRPIGEAF